MPRFVSLFNTYLMLYFIIWAVILVGSLIALPVASMLDKRKLAAAASGYDGGGLGQDDYQEEYEAYDESPGEAVDDGFGGDQDFPADAMPDLEQPVGGDDFSAFDEEFK